MEAQSPAPGTRRRWPLAVGLCVLVGTAEGLGAALDPDSRLPLLQELGLHWAHWAAWALLFPVFDALVRAFPLDAGRRLRSVAAYVGLAPVLIGAHGLLHFLIAGQFSPLPESPSAAGAFVEEFV